MILNYPWVNYVWVVSLLLLLYLIWPYPSGIDKFTPLPNVMKSSLEGDTIQVPNVAGYFSNNYRSFVVPFYLADYQRVTKLPFPPLRLNHPPEFAFVAIKDQTQSTYLEELVYPLKGSLYVNGFEPFLEDGQPRYWGAKKLDHGGQEFDTKTTLRFYPSPLWVRLLIWFGLNIAVLLMIYLVKGIEKHE